MEFHSRTVDSQNPRRKARDTVTLEISRRISAISVARACCTNGLSDIQKPGDTRSNLTVVGGADVTHSRIFPSTASPSPLGVKHRVRDQI